MGQTTLIIDADTAEALNELKETFGLRTNASVIRRALALARVAGQNAGADHTLTIVDQNQNQKKVMLRG